VHEAELIEAVVAKAWPERADEDLRFHVAGCATCTAVAELAAAIAAERDAACAEAAIPSSAVVWWRARMRARREAEEQAARPIAAALGVAFVCVVALVVALAPLARGWIGAWMSQLGSLAPDVSVPTLSGLWPPRDAASWLAAPLPAATIICTIALLVLAPVALYMALADD
jgi:hypothetical protein